MKDVINYYYNLIVDKIYKDKNIYFFFNDEKYYVLKCNDSKKLKDLNNFINSLSNKRINVSELIETKNGKLSFEYKNNEYVIIKMPEMEKVKVNLKDILKYNINVGNNFDFIKQDEYIYMTNLVDYFEEKMIGYSEEYPLLQTYFNYYVGLSENAISYLNNCIKENSSLIIYSLSHKKIRNCTLGEIVDITNITYNYRMKDIAEYIKYKIINREEWYTEIESLFKSFNLNEFDYKFIYCSTIFPDYFYDLIQNIIDGDRKENEISDLVSNINYVESEISSLYNLISKYCKIPKIEWIK